MVRYSLNPENPAKCELLIMLQLLKILAGYCLFYYACVKRKLKVSFLKFFSMFCLIKLCLLAAVKARGSHLRVHFKVNGITYNN